MIYKQEYDKIKLLPPKKRGFQFEKLVNKICHDEGILLSDSYKTADTEQQIDGAIEINKRIFLIEAKWERTETLAASKLYSFLGKINSKIEGTIGIFISHNVLSDNFISAVRNGLRQNCILIHGEENILDIMDGKVSLEEFIWYTYQQASTKNLSCINTSEFLSIPIRTYSKTTTTTLPPQNWIDIYQNLVDTSSTITFSAQLETLYTQEIELSKKALNLISILKKDRLSHDKYILLIQKCFSEEKDEFEKQFVEKLKSPFWKEYIPLLSIDFIKNDLAINELDKTKILDKAISHLTAYFGTYAEENNASYLIDFLFERLNENDLKKLANAYLIIYCDTSRLDYFPQKQTSIRIFNNLKRKSISISETVRPTLIEQLRQIKNDEYFSYDDLSDEKKIKESSIKFFIRKFIKVLDDGNSEKFLSKEYDKL